MAEKVNMPSQKKEKKKKRKKKLPSDFYDYNLLACTILLVSFGLIMLYSASAYEAASTFKGNDMYYFTHQAGLSAIVLVGIVILSKFVDYHSVWFQRIAALVYWGSLLLMAAVRFTPLGYEAYGARRWLRIGGVSLQLRRLESWADSVFAIHYPEDGKKYAYHPRKSDCPRTWRAAGAGCVDSDGQPEYRHYSGTHRLRHFVSGGPGGKILCACDSGRGGNWRFCDFIFKKIICRSLKE